MVRVVNTLLHVVEKVIICHITKESYIGTMALMQGLFIESFSVILI